MSYLIPGYWTSAFLSVALHEAAHLVTAFSLKVKVKRVGINWRGPYIVREPGTRVKNTLVSLAGPGINLLLCVLSFRLALTFSLVNGFMSFFNLLPFVPASDGQRVYRLWTQRAATSPTAPVSALGSKAAT